MMMLFSSLKMSALAARLCVALGVCVRLWARFFHLLFGGAFCWH